MTVGFLKITIYLNGIGSLKDKRRIIKSLTGRLKSRFNFSVSEIAAQDSKSQAVLGLAVVGSDGRFIESQLDTVSSFVQADARFYVGKIDREIFSFDDN